MKLAKDTLYFEVIGAMPGPKLEPMLYTSTGDNAWPSGDNTTWTDDSGNPPVKAVGRGFCFGCDKPVEMEYHQWWVGDGNYQPPKTCLECGGHDVEFIGRVAERLWQRIQFNKRLEYSLKHHAEIFQRLADMELDTPAST